MYIRHFQHFEAFKLNEEKHLQRKTKNECIWSFVTYWKALNCGNVRFEGEKNTAKKVQK